MESIKIENKTTEQHFKEKAVSASTKRRFGDRTEGRRLRSIEPMAIVAPFIMPSRMGAQNLFQDSINVTAIEHFINCRVCADNIATTGHKSIFKRIEALCPP